MMHCLYGVLLPTGLSLRTASGGRRLRLELVYVQVVAQRKGIRWSLVVAMRNRVRPTLCCSWSIGTTLHYEPWTSCRGRPIAVGCRWERKVCVTARGIYFRRRSSWSVLCKCWLGLRTGLEEATTKLSALVYKRISILWSFSPLPSHYTELSD